MYFLGTHRNGNDCINKLLLMSEWYMLKCVLYCVVLCYVGEANSFMFM